MNTSEDWISPQDRMDWLPRIKRNRELRDKNIRDWAFAAALCIFLIALIIYV